MGQNFLTYLIFSKMSALFCKFARGLTLVPYDRIV
jgi:hypothetical protein